MWVEDGAGKASVFNFHAVSTLEASLLCILEATAGHVVLFVYGPGEFPLVE
jgi:hypothetical protein